MDKIDRLWQQYSHSHEVKDNFTDAVFRKINRKKRQKRVFYSLTVFVLIGLGILSFYHWIYVPKSRMPVLTSKVMTLEKEEIPVIEKFNISTHDQTTDYVVERVSLQDRENEI